MSIGVIVGKKITILFRFSNGKQLAAANAGWAALQAAAKSCGLQTFTYSNPLRPQIRDGARSAIIFMGWSAQRDRHGAFKLKPSEARFQLVLLYLVSVVSF